MLSEIFARHWITLHGLVVLLGLAVYVIGSHTLRQRRHPSAAIAWVVSLVLLPYAALPLYLMLGSRKVVDYRTSERARSGAHRAGADKTAAMSEQLATALGIPDAASFDELAIHEDGRQALQALRALIAGATRTLDLCTFIFASDVLGDEIARLLMTRAREGLKIRLLVDGVGVYLGGQSNLKRMAAAGVQVALFVSPFRSALRGRTNLRNHRKLAIADGRWMWCGGRNIAAEYFEGDPASSRKKKAWLDLSFDLTGALAGQGQQRFEQDWIFATRGVSAATLPPPGPVQPRAAGRARLVASGPDQADDTIYTLLVSGCFTARSRILAVTPYFVPDPPLLMGLVLAARRGVMVDLLLPARSNHRLADLARLSALRELAAAGARVWLGPDMIHAKAILIDDELALVGSANLDGRSLFLNYELMVAFYDPPVVQRFAAWIDSQRARAAPCRPRPPGLLRDLAEGVVRWLAFQL